MTDLETQVLLFQRSGKTVVQHFEDIIKEFGPLVNNQSNNPENSKYVVQLHMTTWPDFDVPNLSEFQTFMKDYRELKCAESHRYSPTLVHCTAGVGRTEFNCVYYDIPGIILQMRRCRPSMVQKVAQYIFLHQFANTLFQ
ncbi:unnamed protein product [Schistosoma guineensis]|nr:unnamed protein product [Schistosoma guineensis]